MTARPVQQRCQSQQRRPPLRHPVQPRRQRHRSGRFPGPDCRGALGLDFGRVDAAMRATSVPASKDTWWQEGDSRLTSAAFRGVATHRCCLTLKPPCDNRIRSGCRSFRSLPRFLIDSGSQSSRMGSSVTARDGAFRHLPEWPCTLPACQNLPPHTGSCSR